MPTTSSRVGTSPAESRIVLEPPPPEIADRPVRAWRAPVEIDTYEPGAPDRYPAYLDRRVYQGSSGAVYPLPFIDQIAHTKRPRRWDAIHLENEYVRLMLLPELGGRIHIGLDKTRDYDFFYRNDVIKPALVGLAGPWVSGGVEFNWPQHHRPATFLPTETLLEEEEGGAVTVWCSDHDPFARMQGMHGVRLRPSSSLVEVRARLVNRTDDVQTFLWWANVAAAVNDDYQSFFPTDVHVIADHAKRALSTFPVARGRYYGVDYPAQRTPERPDGDRLDWYRNIPVPTSYMCLATTDDFFGGYDHSREAGFVHWADHRIAPGKKQWTWGHAAFGRMWDSHLTDTGGPYVELMAGVFTDNQPDFSFLMPGETRAFSQYWYPIQGTGPVHQATREIAISLDLVRSGPRGTARIAVATTRARPGAHVVLRASGASLHEATADIAPGSPYVHDVPLDQPVEPTACELTVVHDGDVLLVWSPRPAPVSDDATTELVPADEPPLPSEIASADELYVTGLHLAQYRHATRSPEPYWREALSRDPGDARCRVALAARRQHDGRLDEAERHLRAAVARSTRRNPNPREAESHYRLGLVLARQGRDAEAREALGTAMWDQGWSAAATVVTARLDLAAGHTARAREDLEAILVSAPGHLQARNLATVAARRLGDLEAAREIARGTLDRNPLDAWARDLGARLGQGVAQTEDPTTALDVALEYLLIREDQLAEDVLDRVPRLPLTPGQTNVAPLAWLHRADLELLRGDMAAADDALDVLRSLDRTWCFPSANQNDALARLRRFRPDDPVIAALAGHWLYAAGRRRQAIEAWQIAAGAPEPDPVVLRNLGVAAYNVEGAADLAAGYYARARQVAPDDARLLFEADQLDGRRGIDVAVRLDALLNRPDLVSSRDDLTLQLAELLTAQGHAAEALTVLGDRAFQPWEGGEGLVLAAWEESHFVLARAALDAGDAQTAIHHAEAALSPPPNLGEARHPLANTADLHLLLGDALAANGDRSAAQQAWETAAGQQGDFQAMQVEPYSERTAASVTALRRLRNVSAAARLRDGLARYVAEQAKVHVRVDYFATSLPRMLLFTDDPQVAHDTRVQALRAQLASLDGRAHEAAMITAEIRARDPLNSSVRAAGRLRQLATSDQPGSR
jgi:tetratricopeptide (TPR) repeat protein